MNKWLQVVRQNWLSIIVHVGAFLPLLYLIWGFYTDRLSVNPIDDFTNHTGKAALALLLWSLAVTPVSGIFGFKQAIKQRRWLGLYAFMYAALHLLVFVGLDYGFSLEFILKDGLVEKPYVVAGFAAFLILLPLAITSTKGWMRRLGRNWKRLHKWVYLAGGLAALHFIWVAKADFALEPLIYTGLFALLMIVRIPAVRQYLRSTYANLFGQKRTAARPAGTKAQAATMKG